MKNKFKTAFVFSVVIIVCCLSILTCYAQDIDSSADLQQNKSATELELNSSEINREEMPDNNKQNSDGLKKKQS